MDKQAYSILILILNLQIRSEETLHNLTLFSDKAAICSINARSDNQLIAAGSAEGEVVVINNQNGKILANFASKKRTNQNEDEGSNSIESVIFSPPEVNQVMAADVDGNLTVWDLSSHVAKVSNVLGK